jgi:WD40 repeat protein
MRKAIAIAVLGGGFLVGLILGCGGKYDKPLDTDRTPRTSIYLWVKGMTGFQGGSSFGINDGWLYVAFPGAGQLKAYFATGKQVPSVAFEDAGTPVVLGIGGSEVAIADTSDTMTVKVYNANDGGEPLRTLRDPEWEEIGGIAIDPDGNVYISDTGRNFIRAYDSSGKLKFGEDLADSGFGIGHVLSPRGIFYSERDELLYVAESDGEKAQVQRVSVKQPQTGVPFSGARPFLSTFIDTLDTELPLVHPVAVAVNDSGEIFVSDAFYGWIIEFDQLGNTAAIVTAPGSKGPLTLEDANSLGTYRNRVYALERATATIHRWDKGEPVSK